MAERGAGAGDCHHTIHKVVEKAGNHAVEINIRIRGAHRERERRHTPAILPIGCSTPTPNATPPLPNGSMSYQHKVDSWAFCRGQNLELTEGCLNNLGTMPVPKPPENQHHRKEVGNIATQTDQARSKTTSTSTNVDFGQSKEHIETINQLNQLRSKLKAELAEINSSKDKMESNLLGIIREKDAVIFSYQSAQARTPVRAPRVSVSTSTSPGYPSATKADLGKFRGVLGDVHQLIRKEIEDMKRPRPYVATPTRYLDPLLRGLRLDDTEDIEGTGEILGYGLYNANGDSDNSSTTGGDTSSVSSSSVLTGHFSRLEGLGVEL